MKPLIRESTREEIKSLIYRAKPDTITALESQTLDECLRNTSEMWIGLMDGAFVCAWGLVAPTIMSDQAYLWLFTSEAVKECEFTFVRQSQRAVEEMLKLYPRIIGVASASAPSSIRWLKWLGASFKEPHENGLIPFVIRAKHG